MEPKVFIIIPTWDEREILQQCLDSLERTDYSNFEVVVVDNGSEDGSASMVEEQFPDTFVIENDENRGFAVANNQGFRFAMDKGADYVLMLNNDTRIIDEEWLSTIVSVGESNDEIGVVGCKIVEPDGSVHYDGRYFPRGTIFPVLRRFYQYNRYEDANPETLEYVDDVVGALFLIKSDVIEEIGGLDEAYSPIYYEESDYCVRVWNAEYRVAYTDETSVEHSRGETSKKIDSAKMESLSQINRTRFITKNYPMLWVLFSIPGVMLKPVLILFARNCGDDSLLLVDSPISLFYCIVNTYITIFQLYINSILRRTDRDDIKTLTK